MTSRFHCRFLVAAFAGFCALGFTGPLCCQAAAAQAPVPASDYSSYILTPKPGPAPRLTGAKIFGVRPGSPFLFTITATGDRPMTFAADNLPAGLKLDPATGQITGALKESDRGDHLVTVHAKNAAGTVDRPLKIVVGDQIALTPPMGWNSWNSFAGNVRQQDVEHAVNTFIAAGLINHGWSYINIDDSWQAERAGPNHAIQFNSKFPDIKGLVARIHALGLKAGIYSTPWVTSYATYPGGSSDNPDGLWIHPPQGGAPALNPNAPDTQELARINAALRTLLAADSDTRTVLDKYPAANLLTGYAPPPVGTVTGNGHQIGQYHFATADAKQWADSGFDYLKYDWDNQQVADIKEMSDALRNSGRDIVYSLSNSLNIRLGNDLDNLANAWRTTGDVQDVWGKTVTDTYHHGVAENGFSQDRWAPFVGPGHWIDPDMLVVGWVTVGSPMHSTFLTPDEQYTHISIWCLLSAPLLIGCDMDKLDDFTLNLLTNDEVLDIDQDSLGKPGVQVSGPAFVPPGLPAGTPLVRGNTPPPPADNPGGNALVYRKELEDGSIAVGLFNVGPKEETVTANWADLKVTGSQKVRDLWRQKDLGSFTDKFSATVPSHGVVLVKISPAK